MTTTNSQHLESDRSSAFELLAQPVKHWIWDKGWRALRGVQEEAIRAILTRNNDLIITAATAAGKTEAAFLPLVSSVLDNPGGQGFDIVYAAPLKALINDQAGRLEDLCEKAEVPFYPWHGDISNSIKRKAKEKPGGVLLITPESLEAMFVLDGTRMRGRFAGVKAIIVDELHALLDNERGVQLRSLLTRMEIATGKRIRRIGLSATLSDMDLVREYLRPEERDSVELIAADGQDSEIKMQLKGYIIKAPRPNAKLEDQADAAKQSVASHIYEKFRGTSNLVFAGSRSNAEWYSDRLRTMSEKGKVPLEFLPHHASLAREERHDLERRLKSDRPTTAICTSTLELGIDIGSVDCVGQIGAPFSVSSLRQRLGRSGRRENQSAVLRMYAVEHETTPDSHPINRLHLDLVRSIAMVELLIQKWCEPPEPQALHLSTLAHQIMSIAAERGGANPAKLYEALCEQGPFRRTGKNRFIELLRQMAKPDIELLEQDVDGDVLLGRRGERIVEHYSFYAVFQTYEEYRVMAGIRQIGTLPLDHMMVPGTDFILSGRRWTVVAIHSEDKVIEVVSSKLGKITIFPSMTGRIHDRVVQEMQVVLQSSETPHYLDQTAVKLLKEAKEEFRRLELKERRICQTGPAECLIATWTGTIKTMTLATLLQSMKYKTLAHDGVIEIEGARQPIEEALEAIAAGDVDESAFEKGSLMTEKYHPYLNQELLLEDAKFSRIDLAAMPLMASAILAK